MQNIRSPISQRVMQISPSGIRRFFDLVSTMEDVVSLGVGEPDFVTPWHISEAGIYAIEKGYTAYTSNYGLLELRQELSRHLKSRYSLDYDPDTELMITVGVSEALDLALRAILDPGDEVLAPEPSYVSYMPCTILTALTSSPCLPPWKTSLKSRLLRSKNGSAGKLKPSCSAIPTTPPVR